ncbi:erg26, C-3 sterol dehydrogenase [Komagataella kurtzmanii]|nr:erg26, C-3 sterol dehydrogenase [Komagataella kurtzmanii]
MSQFNSVLLVGGAGFLGSHLVQQFRTNKPDIEIHVFDIRPFPEKLAKYFTFDPKEITFHQGDLTSAEDVSKAIKDSKCQVVVHSASPVHGLGKDIYEKVNVLGTQTLLQVSKELNIKAFVYTSSAGVIFDGSDVYNANETWPIPKVAMDGYNETKAAGEDMVLKANDPKNGFLTIALRPAGIIGPGDRQVVPGLRQVARTGQSKFQLGDNNNLFDWTYVGNVADAHVLAAEKLLNDDTRDAVSGQAFFITNDAPAYFWTLARAVWKADGHIPAKTVVLPRPVAIVAGYLSQTVAGLLGKEAGLTAFRAKVVTATRYHDITKAKTLLGYKPQVDIETGIKYTLEWLNEVV